MKLVTITGALVAAALFAACAPPAANTPAANNSNANSAKPVAAAPTKDALLTLEKAGWEAWKNRDAKWIDANYSDKGFNLGSKGRSDKAAMMAAYGTQKCEIGNYTLSDDKMHMAGADMAVLTFKGTQDATCDGKKLPSTVWAASAFVREGDRWKAAFYAEAPAADPKAVPAKPAASATAKKEEANPPVVAADPSTAALLAVETKAWEAWKNKDAKGLEDFAGKDLVALDSAQGWTDRAVTLKRWSEPSCEIKGVSLTDASSTAFGTDVAILTFKAAVDGQCGGQTLPTEWGATVYVKEGGAWKSLMSMGLPAE